MRKGCTFGLIQRKDEPWTKKKLHRCRIIDPTEKKGINVQRPIQRARGSRSVLVVTKRRRTSIDEVCICGTVFVTEDRFYGNYKKKMDLLSSKFKIEFLTYKVL